MRRHAHERPDALAVRSGQREVTYAELDAAADRIARRLVAAGVVAGDRVATTLAPGADLAALLHATPRLGAALVPLSPRITAAEREAALALSAPRIVIDEPLAGPEADFRRSAALPPYAAHTILFTSGTTAAPKPVRLTYANHLASARASASNLGVKPDDRWLCALPVHHVGGLAILLRSAIYGTAAVVHERFDANAVTASLESGEATLVSLVATQLRRLVAAGLQTAPALRAALLGGGPVPRELLGWAAQRGLPLIQTYGMTETASQVATLTAPEVLGPGRRGSAGRPLEGVELRIACDGEILVRGPMVSRPALGADGWLHTGDRGALDADGYLWVEGRLDEVVVTGGENVAAREVEEALLAHPAVADAAVVGRHDTDWGQAVTAYVVLEPPRGAEPTDAELVAHCRRRLAAHKAPKRIHRLLALPRTDSGKVARSRLGETDASA